MFTKCDKQRGPVPRDITQIAVLIPPTIGYFADLLLGIQEYARAQTDWVLEVIPTYNFAKSTLLDWNPDGALFASSPDEDWASLIAAYKKPAIQVGGQRLANIPQVSTNHLAVGEIAAEHFLQRGFRNYAFCGYTGVEWSNEREAGFRRILERRNFSYIRFPDNEIAVHAKFVNSTLAIWLESLPKPIAIFACHDRVAMLLGKSCELAGIRVPAEISILGVDNNPFETSFPSPPLSSIMGSARRIGYEATATLHNLIKRQPAPAKLLIPPAGVEVRRSTDTLSIDDSDLSAAVRYIHQNADRELRVEDVAEALVVTRRMLERKFRTVLGTTPRDEIVRAHVEKAKTLLVSTHLPALDIAAQSGFPSSSKFSSVFRRETGFSPIAFRKRYGTSARR